MADPGFSQGGRQPPGGGGALGYALIRSSRKLLKSRKIWSLGGVAHAGGTPPRSATVILTQIMIQTLALKILKVNILIHMKKFGQRYLLESLKHLNMDFDFEIDYLWFYLNYLIICLFVLLCDIFSHINFESDINHLCGSSKMLNET